MRRRQFLVGGAAAATAGSWGSTLAQDSFPSRQIHLIVPTSAGGVPSTVVDLSDTPARVLREGPISRAELAALIDLA